MMTNKINLTGKIVFSRPLTIQPRIVNYCPKEKNRISERIQKISPENHLKHHTIFISKPIFKSRYKIELRKISSFLEQGLLLVLKL